MLSSTMTARFIVPTSLQRFGEGHVHGSDCGDSCTLNHDHGSHLHNSHSHSTSTSSPSAGATSHQHHAPALTTNTVGQPVAPQNHIETMHNKLNEQPKHNKGWNPFTWVGDFFQGVWALLLGLLGLAPEKK